jgi:hypothetical protein
MRVVLFNSQLEEDIFQHYTPQKEAEALSLEIESNAQSNNPLTAAFESKLF